VRRSASFMGVRAAYSCAGIIAEASELCARS
jgi:hypothetical protein